MPTDTPTEHPPMQKPQMTKLARVILEATRAEQYKKCQAGVDCLEPAINGHLTPRAYLKRLPGRDNQMKVFNSYRFSADPSLPLRKGIGVASTGYFTCKTHDALFQDADRIADVDQMPSTRTLNLICYRSALQAGWWPELWARAARAVDEEFGKSILSGTIENLRSMSHKISLAQQRLELCALDEDHQDCDREQCKEYQHLIWVSEGPPVLAAAQFGINETDTGELGLWGFTLIPGTHSNAFCIHFPKEAGTRPLDIALRHDVGKPTISGQAVSLTLLKMCDTIVFSEASWSTLNEDEQQKVEQAMNPDKPDPPFDVNLFKGSPWRIL